MLTALGWIAAAIFILLVATHEGPPDDYFDKW